MKLRLFILLIIGAVAALCAAILVSGLMPKKPKLAATPHDVPIIVATKAIPTMTVVTADCVRTKMIHPSDMPNNNVMTNAAQVIGKVLAMPVVKEQVFTKACFATEGSSSYLAAALQKGMRAMSLSLTDYGAMKDLLYPGSSVDILVCLKSTSEKGEVVSKTVLKNIEVLAVRDRTVFADDDKAKVFDRDRGADAGRHLVTVMVSNKQAEVLQLAMDQGSVMLAMRNPTDISPIQSGRTSLKDVFGDSSGLSQLPVTLTKGSTTMPTTAPVQTDAIVDPFAQGPSTMPADDAQASSVWVTTIIRGQTSEVREFPMPEEAQ